MNIQTLKRKMRLMSVDKIVDKDCSWGLVDLTKLKIVEGLGGKGFGGLLSVLSLWGDYIPVGCGKLGWVKL